MVRRLLLAALLASAFVPSSAQAVSGCDSDLVIFSSPASLNANAGRCLLQEDLGFPELRDAPSTAFIVPGSTGVSARWIVANLGQDTVLARLDGMGATTNELTMTWTTSSTGGGFYSLPVQSINQQQSLAGDITLSVYVSYDEAGNPIVLDSVCFHGYLGFCD
ncbi:MAG: hypothetical protein ACLGH3_04625 [Actinomycetota bacterium]